MLPSVRMTIAALCSVVLLSGCITTTDQVMKSRLGDPIDRVIEQWGAADTVAALSDGRRVLTWVSVNGDRSGVSTCRQSFTVGPSGTIEHWSYSGCPMFVLPSF